MRVQEDGMAAYWVRIVRRLKIKAFGALPADGQATQRDDAPGLAAGHIDRAMLAGTVVLLIVAALQFILLVH